MLSWKYLILARVGLFVVVAILGMDSGLIGRGAKMSSSFMIFGELTMALGHGRLDSICAIKK